MATNDKALSFVKNRPSPEDCLAFLLAIFGVYFYQFNQNCDLEFGYGDENIQKELIGLEGFFAFYVPLRIKINKSMSFQHLMTQIKTKIQVLRKRKTYCRDIFFRYPEIGRQCQEKSLLSPIVQRVESLDKLDFNINADLTLFVPESGEGYAWRYLRGLRGLLDLEVESKMPERLNIIARQVSQNLDEEIDKMLRAV
jgi:hypothetical protein